MAALLRRRALIILNPSAGRSRRARRRMSRVIAELATLGCHAELRLAGPVHGDVERLAREAEPEFEVIVAAGGDGTVNAVVNGIAGTARAVAFLPLGTANVLTHEIGLPRSPAALARVIAAGESRPIWPGRAGGRLFVLMASSGFDAEVVGSVDRRLKRAVGRAAFAVAIIMTLARHRGMSLTVTADGITHAATTVIAAKGRFYGGPFVLAPQADLAEPALQLILLRREGRLAALQYLAALMTGGLARRRDVATLHVSEASISAAWPVPVQADGELIGTTPVTIGIAPTPVHLVFP